MFQTRQTLVVSIRYWQSRLHQQLTSLHDLHKVLICQGRHAHQSGGFVTTSSIVAMDDLLYSTIHLIIRRFVRLIGEACDALATGCAGCLSHAQSFTSRLAAL